MKPKVFGLKIGDRIMCLHMSQETSVSPGTTGTVTGLSPDPTVNGATIISVKWDNGSNLSLLSDVDVWKKVKQNLDENKIENFFEKNEALFDFFDRRFFDKFLLKLRETGIVNMYGAAPLIYAGKEHLERYYGEGKEDDTSFQELLDMADTARNKLVQGVVEYMSANNIEIDEEMNKVNSLARRFSKGLLENYIITTSLRGR